MSYNIPRRKVKEHNNYYEPENEYDKQAQNFLRETNTTFKTKFVKHDIYFAGDKEKRDIYKFTLTKDGKSYSGTFGQSIANQGKDPTPYEVLASLSADGSDTNESFEEFADNYGYEHDSRNAEKTYKAVMKQREGINNLYSQEEIEKLQEIQ